MYQYSICFQGEKLASGISSMLAITTCGIVILLASSNANRDGWHCPDALNGVPSWDTSAAIFPPQQ